jgi:plastocyanin
MPCLEPARHQERFITVMLIRTPRLPGTIVTLLAAACWSPAAPGSEAVTVTLADHRFTPDRLEVRVGQPVALTLVNRDRITPHNITLLNKAAGLDIDTDVPAGTSVTVEFTPSAAGTYTFYCDKKLPFLKSHREQGMEGTLIVRDTDPE